MAYLEFKPTTDLYQYTSVEGFEGIIQSKKLWFSDLRVQNDPREISYGFGKIRPLFDLLIKENSENWDVKAMKKILDSSYSALQHTDFFSCCFSVKGDAMPLWQNYGDDGKGISIGFRPRAIVDMPVRIQKVEYLGRDEIEEQMKVKLFKILDSISPYIKSELNIDNLETVSQIVALCTSVKHASWSHEDEIRCNFSQPMEKEATSFMDFTVSLYADGKAVKWRDPSIRKAKNSQIRYLDFKFGKRIKQSFDPSNAIAQIVLGPKCDWNENQVEDALGVEGLSNSHIQRSECNWR